MQYIQNVKLTDVAMTSCNVSNMCSSTCQLLLCDDFGASYTVCEESQAFGVFEAGCHSVQQRPHRFGHSRSPAHILRLRTPGAKTWITCLLLGGKRICLRVKSHGTVWKLDKIRAAIAFKVNNNEVNFRMWKWKHKNQPCVESEQNW